jgi:hypothetical protein
MRLLSRVVLLVSLLGCLMVFPAAPTQVVKADECQSACELCIQNCNGNPICLRDCRFMVCAAC